MDEGTALCIHYLRYHAMASTGSVVHNDVFSKFICYRYDEFQLAFPDSGIGERHVRQHNHSTQIKIQLHELETNMNCILHMINCLPNDLTCASVIGMFPAAIR